MSERPRMKMAAMLRLMELGDYVVPFATRAMATHAMADRLAGGPRPAHDLAAEAGLHPGAVERLMRALSCKGIFLESTPGVFGLSPLSELMRTDHPQSVRDLLTFDPEDVRAWADAGLRVHTGGSAGAMLGAPRGAGTALLAAPPGTATGARERLLELGDHTVPTTIRALAELRVADRLADGPRALPDLAADLSADPATLLAALRSVAAYGIFEEVLPERFATTDLADLMRTDLPHSLQGCLPLMQADLRAWAGLSHTLRTGEPAFAHVHGESYYEYLARRPAESARFDAAQQGATRLELRAALRGFDWGGIGSLVDVGGGNGTFLAGLLQRHPHLRGVLFDLPFVVDLSAGVLAEAGVADRCRVAGGSFLTDPVPAGEDAYLIKRTLYNWDADSALRILQAVRVAMRPDSRLLIFEPTRRPGDSFDVARLTDVIMLVFTGGALRTPEELESLLAAAGLRLHRLIPTPMFPVLEAGPA